MTRTRLQKGEKYYFVSLKEFKLCHTQDWYFESDDKHFNERNYFIDKTVAEEAAEEVYDYASGKLSKIEYERKENVSEFIATVRDLVRLRSCRKKAEGETTPDTERDICSKKETDAAKYNLIRKAYEKYAERKKEQDEQKAEVDAQILKIIKKHNK